MLIPEYGLGIGDKASKDGGSKEPLVWTVGDGPQKINRSNDEKSQVQHGDLMEQTLNKCLEKTSARKLIRPEEVQFSSAMPEAHRKGEKAYHVKAFRGSKDGKHFRSPKSTYQTKRGKAICSFSPVAFSLASRSRWPSSLLKL